MKQADKDYRQLLLAMYGINRRQLYKLPFEIRMEIKSVLFDMLSALYTGSASLPPNNDVLTEQ